MSWTEERVNLLTKLWGEGRTAAEIASELGGVTRNAVIGKAHRLKLSGRVSPIQQNKKSVADKPLVRRPKEVQKVSAPKAQPKIHEPVSSEKGQYSLEQLEARMCRWPIGDPRSDDFGFCGGDAMAGLPYCRDHIHVAYQPATRKRILKAEEAEIAQVASDLRNKKKSA